MKTIPQTTDRRSCSTSKGGTQIEIGILTTDKDKKRFDQLLGHYHYLGETRPVGDFLRQVALRDGEWVGLLAWGSACYALKDRDDYVGWTPTQRAERQKLVVQNRRFLILGKKGHQPNLASQILGAAVRALPDQWLKLFGYTPLLAETFTDIEAFEGTCYKASGWEAVGMSKGYARHRPDFYVLHERPKKLWLKKLHKKALELLCAPHLPERCEQGAHSSAHGVMPIKSKQIDSLFDTLRRMPDPRADNRTFSIGSILAIIAMALLSGYRDISQLHRFGQRLKPEQRKKIGLPKKKGTHFYRVPGYKVYYNLLAKLDMDAFADLLSRWLQAHAGSLPVALAMDGKMIRDTVGIVCLADHETGVPQAMATMSQKEGEGDRCELKTAQKLILQMPDLNGKLITADALNCQVKTAQDIVAQGGEYLLQVKNNQKAVCELAAAKTINLSPLFP